LAERFTALWGFPARLDRVFFVFFKFAASSRRRIVAKPLVRRPVKSYEPAPT